MNAASCGRLSILLIFSLFSLHAFKPDSLEKLKKRSHPLPGISLIKYFENPNPAYSVTDEELNVLTKEMDALRSKPLLSAPPSPSAADSLSQKEQPKKKKRVKNAQKKKNNSSLKKVTDTPLKKFFDTLSLSESPSLEHYQDLCKELTDDENKLFIRNFVPGPDNPSSSPSFIHFQTFINQICANPADYKESNLRACLAALNIMQKRGYGLIRLLNVPGEEIILKSDQKISRSFLTFMKNLRESTLPLKDELISFFTTYENKPLRAKEYDALPVQVNNLYEQFCNRPTHEINQICHFLWPHQIRPLFTVEKIPALLKTIKEKIPAATKDISTYYKNYQLRVLEKALEAFLKTKPLEDKSSIASTATLSESFTNLAMISAIFSKGSSKTINKCMEYIEKSMALVPEDLIVKWIQKHITTPLIDPETHATLFDPKPDTTYIYEIEDLRNACKQYSDAPHLTLDEQRPYKILYLGLSGLASHKKNSALLTTPDRMVLIEPLEEATTPVESEMMKPE